MPEFIKGTKLPTRTANTLKGGNPGFFGFLRGKAVPKQPPTGDALGVLNDPRASSGGGVPPQPPFSTGQWARLAASKIPGGLTIYDAIAKIQFFGGQRTSNIDLARPPYLTATDLEFPGKTDGPEHDKSVVSAARVIQYLLARFNPLRGMTPRRLEQDMEQWQIGFLRWLSLDWSFIRERDDQIKAVEAKRIYAVSRLEWEIMVMDDSPEAESHRQALEDFYDNLTCTHVIDQNQQGGVNMLIRQMMQSVGFKYAFHEIVWVPSVNEDGTRGLTANFRFVPTWFFETRTGVARYLPYELALDGIPLDQGGWLVTIGDGLLMASSILWMYKQTALRAWAAYVEKFGIPFIHGETTAAFNSVEWQQFVSALQNFASDGVMATNIGAKLNMEAPPASAANPQAELLQRCDRQQAIIWRGADLSTMSRAGSGTGALPQIQNEDELAEVDCILVSEALNFYVDRQVIFQKFGPVKPKAYFRQIPPLTIDTAKEIAVDQFLLSAGVPLAQKDTYARYGRRKPDADDEVMTPPAMGAAQIGKGIGDSGPQGALSLGNIGNSTMGDVFRAAAKREMTAAQAKALVPLGERIKALSAIEDPEKAREAAEAIRKDLPNILKEINSRSGELRQAFENIVGTAIMSGATKAAASHAGRV
jgi:phage gp29-like protein